MKYITVEFLLDEENLKLLKEVNELYNKVQNCDSTIESTFEFAMRLGSKRDIKEKLEFLKENFTNSAESKGIKV